MLLVVAIVLQRYLHFLTRKTSEYQSKIKMLLVVAIVVSDFGLAPKTGTRKMTNSGTKKPHLLKFPLSPSSSMPAEAPTFPASGPPAPRSGSGKNLRTMYELCTPFLHLAKKLLETRAKRLALHDPPGPPRHFLGRDSYFGKFRGHRCVWAVFGCLETKGIAENQWLCFLLSFCVYAGRRLVGRGCVVGLYGVCIYLLCTRIEQIVKSKLLNEDYSVWQELLIT